MRVDSDARCLARGSYSYEALLFQVQDDLLSSLFWREFRGVDHNFGFGRGLIRVGNSGELLDDARTCLGIKPLAIALLASFDWSCNVHENESAEGLNQFAYLLTYGVIGRDRCANRNATVLGNLRGDVSDPPDVDVAMFLGEAEFRREVLAHQIAIQNGYGATAHFEE